MSDIQFVEVAMSFPTRKGEVRALDEISLSVPDGQFACIVGPSGCGKSTLLSIAAGLVTPTHGDVLVDGRPASDPGPDRGMVFQSYALYPHMTLYDNMAFGLKLAGTKKPEIDAAAAKHDNARIAAFDNSMGWISYNPDGQTASVGKGEKVPATYDFDWTAGEVPCVSPVQGH